jgi:hypothetical protein
MIMNRKEVENIILNNITYSNVVGTPEEVEFINGNFGTVTWLDSDGDEIEVVGWDLTRRAPLI